MFFYPRLSFDHLLSNWKTRLVFAVVDVSPDTSVHFDKGFTATSNSETSKVVHCISTACTLTRFVHDVKILSFSGTLNVVAIALFSLLLGTLNRLSYQYAHGR